MPCPRVTALLVSMLPAAALAAAPPDSEPKDPPLSPAQIELFETPHLKNVDHVATLQYRFERTGMEPLVDKVSIRIAAIHDDGTKFVSFDFLSGEHHAFFPAVDDFRGNPLLMVFLQYDVLDMRQHIGVAASYFRNEIVRGFADQATVTQESYVWNGKPVPAERITLKPFAHDQRFEHLPAIQAKEYSFVLSEQIPGELAELAASMPADDSLHTPAWTERLTFTGETP